MNFHHRVLRRKTDIKQLRAELLTVNYLNRDEHYFKMLRLCTPQFSHVKNAQSHKPQCSNGL